MHAAKDRMMSPYKFDVYGQYVGTELRALNKEHIVIMAKYYINNILLDARLGKCPTSYNNQNQPTVQQGYSTASRSLLKSILYKIYLQKSISRALIVLITLIVINLRWSLYPS